MLVEAQCVIYPDNDKQPNKWTVAVKWENAFDDLKTARAFSLYLKEILETDEFRQKISEMTC
jgi:hypothetical protein